MRLLLLELTLLLAVLHGSEAQWNILEKAKSIFQDTRQQVVNTLVDVANKAKPISDDLLAGIKSGDLSQLSISTLVNGNISKGIWSAMGPGPILTMGPNKVKVMLSDSAFDITPQLRKQLNNYLAANVSQTEAIKELRKILGNPQGNEAKILLLMDRLGDPMDWMKENITNMRQIIFQLPMDKLTKVTNAEAINEIDAEASKCIAGSPSRSASCPSDMKDLKMAAIRSWIYVKINGEPQDWKNETFKNVQVNTMDTTMLPQVQPNVLVAKKKDIINMLNSNTEKRNMIGRDIVVNLMEAENIRTTTDTAKVIAFLTSLGSKMKELVFSSDLNPEVLQNINIKNTMKTNRDKAILAGMLSPEEAMMLMKDMYGKDTQYFQNLMNVDRNNAMGTMAMASPSSLGNVVNNINIPKDLMNKLTTAITKNCGTMAKGKLGQIAPKVFDVSRSGNTLDMASIQDPMVDLISLKDMMNMDLYTARNILKREVMLSVAQNGALLSKLGSNSGTLQQVSANTRAMVPASTMAKASNNNAGTLRHLATDLPASSATGMLAATRIFGTSSGRTSPAIQNNLKVLPLMDASAARRIDDKKLDEAFMQMKDSQPSREACFILKGKLANNTMKTLGAKNERQVFSLLDDVQLETIPACVVAAFGVGRIMSMDPMMKIILLERFRRLGMQVFTGTGIEPRTAKAIIMAGFKALGKTMLSVDTVADYESQLLLAPANVLKEMSQQAIPAALKTFNSLAMTPAMPCLGGARRDAIRSLMFEYKGDDLSEWTDISDMCCLLFVLSPSQLNNVNDVTLVSCVCKMKDVALYQSDANGRKMDCIRDVGEGGYNEEVWAKKMVKERQDMAAVRLLDQSRMKNRRKRAASDVSICDRAAISGADSISQGEIEAASDNVLMPCLTALGSRYMAYNKANALAKKVQMNQTEQVYSQITAQTLADMNFILKGIESKDITNLKSFTYTEFNDVVAILGDTKMELSDTQRTKYASKVSSDWKKATDWTKEDVQIVNKLLCGMSDTEIGKINPQALKGAISTLSVSLEGCPQQVNQVIFDTALKAYNDPSSWSKADVRELGMFTGYLSPTNFGKIKADAIGGITPEAIKLLNGTMIKELDYDKILNMDQTTASSFSSGQIAGFTSQMLAAHKTAMLQQSSAATDVMFSRLLMFLLVAVAITI